MCQGEITSCCDISFNLRASMSFWVCLVVNNWQQHFLLSLMNHDLDIRNHLTALHHLYHSLTLHHLLLCLHLHHFLHFLLYHAHHHHERYYLMKMNLQHCFHLMKLNHLHALHHLNLMALLLLFLVRKIWKDLMNWFVSWNDEQWIGISRQYWMNAHWHFLNWILQRLNIYFLDRRRKLEVEKKRKKFMNGFF